MKKNSILYLAAIILVLGCSNSKQSKPDRLAKASRENKNGWIYVHLEGSPIDIGYQHGFLLANDIDTSIQSVSYLLQHDTHRDWAFYRSAAKIFYGTNLIGSIKTRSMALLKGCRRKTKVMIVSI